MTDEQVSTAKAVEATPVGGGGGGGGGSESAVPIALYWGMAFTSTQLLIVTCYDCNRLDDGVGTECENKLAYAVFTAIVTVVLVLIQLLVKLVPQISGACACWNQFVEPFLAISLWIFWVVSLPILTMPDHENASSPDKIAPYLALGTGWLMTWMTTVLATLMVAPAFGKWYQSLCGLMPCLANVGPAKEASASMLLGVFLLSCTVMWCAADECDHQDKAGGECDDEYAWGLTVALGSMIYCVILLACGKCLDHLLSGTIIKFGALVLTIWWWLGATVITVTQGPDDGMVFTSGVPANGFFGTWLAFFLSAFMCAEHFKIIDSDNLLGK